jgi:branched-chain amino acid transport system ATP-binding protein
MLRPRAAHPSRVATADLLDASASRTSRTRTSPRSRTASSASSRSAWRSPARRGSSSSTSPPPASRPRERRELVLLLGALPKHMGFVLIEHDLEIALKAVERVTVMHDGAC